MAVNISTFLKQLGFSGSEGKGYILTSFDLFRDTMKRIADEAGFELSVDDSGVTVVTPTSVINFTGAGVAVSDAGNGQADVNIPGANGWSLLSDQVLNGDAVETVEMTGLPTDLLELELVLSNLTTNGSPNGLGIQVSTDNGASWITAANYIAAALGRSSGGANRSTSIAGDDIARLFFENFDFGAGQYGRMRMANLDPANIGAQFNFQGHVSYVDSGAAVFQTSGGFLNDSTIGRIDAIRLNANSNITVSGNLQLWGR